MIDLTCIFLTVNRVPEEWAKYHWKVLKHAIWKYPLITVSRVPMPHLPGKNLIQTEEPSASNVYRQLLRAAKEATTKYIAVAEDDSLYPREHFTTFRPGSRRFAYNMTRWSLYTWGTPTYSFKDRISNLTLVAPRKLLIQCLEERFKMYPDGTPDSCTGEVGKVRIEQKLSLPHYDTVMWNSVAPIVNFNHSQALDDKEVRQVKRLGWIRAYDIPYWGKAEELVLHFK